MADSNKTLREEIQDTIQEKAIVEKKTAKIMQRFYQENSNVEIMAIIKCVSNSGHPRYTRMIDEFKKKYETDSLDLEDTQTYLDFYDEFSEKLKNMEDDE